MKTRIWAYKAQLSIIQRDIDDLIKEGKIKEVVSLSYSVVEIGNNVNHFAIMIYK